MSKDYFYHNGVLLSEDELMHWKYIKREKVNGKWRYYYDQSELDNKKKNISKKASGIVNAMAGVEQAEKNLEKAKYTQIVGESKIARDAKIFDSKYNLSKAEDDLEKAKRDFDWANEDYDRTERNTIIQRSISKGIVAAANALSKLTSKPKKKKKKK